MKRTSTLPRIAALMVSILLTLGITTVQAAIPASERTALLNLYASTNGGSWITSTGWNGAAGTECTWAGVTCNGGGTTVTGINLSLNNLTGSLPALAGLTNLQDFAVGFNQLTGTLPALAGLTNLQNFEAFYNQLSGPIPALTGLTNLQTFEVYNNQLTGTLPALTGLTNLQDFAVHINQLTGTLPALAGLTNLQDFEVYNNQLAGTLPALTGLTNLRYFDVDTNQLTGPLPALTGLTNLQTFDVSSNQLTGTLPALTGLTNLEVFDVNNNQLTGPIPALTGLTYLGNFEVNNNQLTGTLPALTGLTNLEVFSVVNNQLTGSIPALTGLTYLGNFEVNNNQLTGNVPSVPSPDALVAGGSSLCPNSLNQTSNSAWDAATGQTPWYSECNISGPAYTVINTRTAQNQSQFFVYEDADSPFNHGFPSGLFGSSTAAMGKLHRNPSCVYSADATNGCSTNPNAIDQTRGTVFQFTFDPLASGESVGLIFEEPQGFVVNGNGTGYDLTGATQLVFDAISPSGGMQVQFSVNGSTTAYMSIPQQWSTITINLSSLGLTSLTGVHLLFGIASNYVNARHGGTVLLDNIRFLPVPTSQTTALGLPLANQVFGIEHVQNSLPGSIPIPPDQINSNLATLYESSLAIIALINRGQPQDLTNAKLIADTLVYALGHDNEGDPLPAPAGTAGLHNGTFAGDIALFNSQGAGAGQQGQVRLAGFTASVLCPQTGFCLVLDGATGGNDAFGILGLLAAYKQFQSPSYLNAALTVGNWIYSSLLDSSGTGYGGYFVGYPDMGLPKVLQTSKSTENNADIFAAFTALASAENAAGNTSAAALWTTRANVAGDYAMQMYDSATGHFFAGTVPSTQGAGSGIYPNGVQKGNDVINTFDFLDTETFTTLAMATAPRYQNQIDWHLPVQWVINHFQSSVTAANVTFQGFDLIDASERLATGGPAGIAWEFTGQAVAAMDLVDTLYGTTQFVSLADTYLDQIQDAQMGAPFTDGQGVVASTLQNGDTVAPYDQCLVTPYQCIAERVGLAATIWGIAAEQGLDPFAQVVNTAPAAPSGCSISGAPSTAQAAGFQATLTMNCTAGGAPTSYTWTGTGAAGMTTQTVGPITVNATTTFTATASNAGGTSAAAQATVTISGGASVNVALAANGGVASASSTYVAAGFSFPVSAVNNGDRAGLNWGEGGGWNSATANLFPDWVQITFNGQETIDQVIVYTLQDNYANPVDPPDNLTFTLYGVTAFQVQGWNGSAWVNLGAAVSGNNLVKRPVSFPAFTTNMIRVNITAALDSYARITEIEAWTPGGAPAAPSGCSISGAPSTAQAAGFQATLTMNCTAGGAPTSYTWTGTGAAGMTTQTVGPITVNATTTFTATASNATGTSAAAAATVTISGGASVNVALAANGGVASASSTYVAAGFSFPVSAVNNGDRAGLNWGEGGGWNSATANLFPDWVQITFNGQETIDQVIVYTLQDNYANPVDPPDNLTFTLYGVTAFQVQGWNGSAWVNLGAAVAGNNLVKRPVNFAAFTTNMIRVNITAALDSYARITEIEAWTPGGAPAAPSGCSISGAPSTAQAAGFQATLTMNCTAGGAPTAYTWTGTSAAGQTTQTVGPITVNATTTFTATASNAGGTSAAAAATVTISGGGGGGSVVCAGFPATLSESLAYDGPNGVGFTSLTTYNTGGFAANGALVVQFTTPAVTTPPTRGIGSISLVEFSGPPTTRTGAVSTTPCDFTTGITGQAGVSSAFVDSEPRVYFTLGVKQNGYLQLLPNTTYYLNVENTYNGIPTCSATSTCDVKVTLTKQPGT